MKFVSNFTDFYDYAGIGYDSNLVYERMSKSIRLDDKTFFNIVPEFFSSDYKIAMKQRQHVDRNGVVSYYIPFAIVFCGIVKVGIKKSSGGFYSVKRYIYEPQSESSKAEMNFFNAERNNVRERMLELSYPILYLSHNEHILNPRLIDFDYHLQMDATEAYQEMEMFIGVLKNNEQSVKIADKYLKKQKGFTDCSFKSCNRN